MKLPEKLSLNRSVHSLEDGIITLSGPALAISSVLAVVDLLTGGHILQQYAWFSLAWALCLALTLDFQILALGARSHQIYQADKKTPWRKGIEITLCLIVAAAISLVSIQMQSIIARVNSIPGLSVEGAASQLGINTIYLIWERSALVLVLIFLSGWFREVKKQVEQDSAPSVPSGTNTSISEETMRLILERLAKVEQLEQVIGSQKTTVTAENSKPLALPVPSASTSLSIAPMRVKPMRNILSTVDYLLPAKSSIIPFVPLSSDSGTEDDERAIQAHIVEVLTETPDIKVRELAAIVGHPQTTVYRHMVQVKKQMEQSKKESEA